MSYAAGAVSKHPNKADTIPKKSFTSSKVVFTGLIRLISGQQRFAEELGLPYNRVFDDECLIFRDKNPEQVLQDWLRDKDEGPHKLNRLINDLVEHNLALYAALDGVALESISRLSPKAVKASSFSIFGWRPFAWLTFRRIHRSYVTNDYLRHQELVVNGFAKAYCSNREELRKSAPFHKKTFNPQTSKEHHNG